MIESILHFDRDLFLAMNFNGGEFLDNFFWIVSGKLTWVPLYVLIIVLLWRRYGWRYMLMVVLCMVLAVVIVDHIANFFKEFLPKLRPARNPELDRVIHLVDGYRGSRYGTISSHAATTAAVMTVSSAFIRRNWFTIMMIVWVALVSYSRIYLGLHYPLDIFFGILNGVVIGVLMVRLFRWIIRKLQDRYNKEGKVLF